MKVEPRVGSGLVAAAVIMLVAASGTSVPSSSAAPKKPPNVVVVMTDDQAEREQPVMHHVKSELGEKGATFANSFVNWPACCPSRATFYSGRYAHNHGVLGNVAPLGGFTRFHDSDTLPTWLQEAGYHTIHIGKYLNGYGRDGRAQEAYVPPGWDEWYAATGVTTQSVYNYTLNQNGSLVGYGAVPADFKQDVFTNLAVDAIERNAAQGPLFLSVMYTAPHIPGPGPSPQPPTNCGDAAQPAPRDAAAFAGARLPTPPSFNEADVSDKPRNIRRLPRFGATVRAAIARKYRCRLESLVSVDEGVDRMVTALKEARELHDTLFIFTSDNGLFAGEHRIQGGKNRVYEEAIRVPLVIRGPGVPRGVKVKDLAINADLAPTILDAAGAREGRVADGRSLLPFADHPRRAHGRELLIEVGDQGDDEDGVNGAGFVAVRTSRYVYVENNHAETELYDLARDPHELTNRHGDPAYAEAERRLAERLASLRTCAGKGCKTKPSLRLGLPGKVRRDGHSCRPASRFVVRVKGSSAGRVDEVIFRVGAKRVGHDRGAPLRTGIPSRRLHKRKPEIRAIVKMVDGRKRSLQRRVRICH